MKHMKKSMFITTVLMVVLLIVAVSTATFAWYTSSNTVNTVATEVNSASSTGANISIGWSAATPVGTSSLTFYDVPNTTTFHPMVPLKTGETFTFNNDTVFNTAVISYGNLSNHAPAAPYIGRQGDGGSSTFYVINYARVATNVKFSANVTGENAARLRVAVFNATSGALVFTNVGYYTGEIVPTAAAIFDLLSEQPADWADNFRAYSTSIGTFTAVAEVAPAFKLNTYYAAGGGALLTEIPVDWAGQYKTYSTTTNGIQTDVVGVAPPFAGSIYAYTASVPEHMITSASVVAPTALNVAIAASGDGVTGVAQGFIVKAWFDGPTQVDAFGGMPARFALTVEATNVTP